MRHRSRLAIIIIAGFVTACSAIVAGQFSETNDFPVPDKCALAEPSVANRCVTCISERCKSHVDFTCQRGETTKSAFNALKNCSTHPYVGYGEAFEARDYECSSYDKPDAQPIQADDDPAKVRAAELCVRDQCLSGPSPACKLCPVRAEKPGSTGSYAELRSNGCGECLEANCNDIIVDCCTTGVIKTAVAMCAYIAEDSFRKKCQTLAVLPDAGGPDDPNKSRDEKCTYDMSKCYMDKCALACPK